MERLPVPTEGIAMYLKTKTSSGIWCMWFFIWEAFAADSHSGQSDQENTS